MTRLILGLILWGLASSAWAIEEFKPVTFHAGAISDGDGLTVPVGHYGTLGVDVAITNTATATFQGRSAGGSFQDIRCLRTSNGAVSVTATSSGTFQCPVAGLVAVKIPVSDCSSCAVVVTGNLTTATIAALASVTAEVSGADGAILDGANASIKATVKDYTNSNPITTILVDTNGDPASLGGGTEYTEDAAAAVNPVGKMGICRRRDTLTASEVTTDGDNIATNCTSKGEVYVKQTDAVTITDGSGALTVDGTVAATQSGTWDVGTVTSITDPVAVTGTFWQATQPVSGTVTVTDGAGALNTIVDSGTLTAVTTITNPVTVTGTVTANAGSGTFTVSGTTFDGVIKDGTGDTTQANVSSGALHVAQQGTVTVTATNLDVQIGGSDTLVTNPGTAANWGIYVEDAGETAGGNLMMSGSVRRDTAASSAGSTGDNATINTDANGLLWSRTIDPCSALAKTYIPINISTATTTELTAALAGASTHYYVCSLNLVTASANNVALVDDDTDNCASVTSGLAGGTTAGSGWNFAANGGLTFGNGQASIFRTNGTNRVLCLVTSASTQLSGSMTVVAAP